MRFSKTLALAAAIVAAASFTACKTTSAEGSNSSSGSSASATMSTDGGMSGSVSTDAGADMGSSMSMDGGTASMSTDGGSSMGSTMGNAASDMGAAAGQAGRDMKQGAQAAGHEMSGMASGAADAGMQAASSAGSSMKDTASSAASSASGAASSASDTAAGATSGSSKQMSDAQFAAWAVAANTSEVNAGKYAASHAQSPKVKSFARMMVKDHTKANKEAKALASKAGMTPEETDTSRSLTDSSKQDLESMKSMQGADFDKAYVDAQVKAHQQVLDTMDSSIPNLQNADLKALATKHRAAVAKHLDHAKTLQSSLGGSSDTKPADSGK